MAGENIAAPTLDELFREEPFVADIGPRNALNFPGWGDLVRVEKPLRSDLNTVLKDAREPPSKQRSSVYFEDFKKFSEAWVSHDLGFKWERLFVVLEKDTFGLWSSRREWVLLLLLKRNLSCFLLIRYLGKRRFSERQDLLLICDNFNVANR